MGSLAWGHPLPRPSLQAIPQPSHQSIPQSIFLGHPLGPFSKAISSRTWLLTWAINKDYEPGLSPWADTPAYLPKLSPCAITQGYHPGLSSLAIIPGYPPGSSLWFIPLGQPSVLSQWVIPLGHPPRSSPNGKLQTIPLRHGLEISLVLHTFFHLGH